MSPLKYWSYPNNNCSFTLETYDPGYHQIQKPFFHYPTMFFSMVLVVVIFVYMLTSEAYNE